MPARDRAAVIAIAVFQITTASSLSEAERRLHIENLLRNEFTDLKRQIANERNGSSDV
jgi:hypothetical protein